MDAHTGFWDASAENCKNKYGEAFVETFYAFPTGQGKVTLTTASYPLAEQQTRATTPLR